MRPTFVLGFAAFVVQCCTSIDAQVITSQAVATAEIRAQFAPSTDDGTIGNALTSGIRQFSMAPDGDGTSDLFFNVQANSSDPFAATPIADFEFAGGGPEPVSATLTLFEFPAGFATPGTFEVYLVQNTDTNLISVADNPANGVPSYQVGNNGLAAIDPAFDPFSTALGSAFFTPTGFAAETEVFLDFQGDALATLSDVVVNGGRLRLALAAGDDMVVGTFGGQSFVEDPDNPKSPRLAPTLTVTTAEKCLPGDVNQDGEITLLDVDPFVSLLTAGGFQCEADVNQDGVVSLLDVDPFVALLSGG